MKITFLKLFLIRLFKDPKLAEKWTNLAEKKKKILNSAEFMELVFSKSGSTFISCLNLMLWQYGAVQHSPILCPTLLCVRLSVIILTDRWGREWEMKILTLYGRKWM